MEYLKENEFPLNGIEFDGLCDLTLDNQQFSLAIEIQKEKSERDLPFNFTMISRMCHYMRDNKVEQYEVIRFFDKVILPVKDKVTFNTTILNFLLSILMRYDLMGSIFDEILAIETPLDAARVNLMINYYSKQQKHYEAYKFLMGIEDNIHGYKVQATNLIEHYTVKGDTRRAVKIYRKLVSIQAEVLSIDYTNILKSFASQKKY